MKQESEKHILPRDLSQPILESAWITRNISPTSITLIQDSPSPPASSSGASTTEVICTDCVVCGDKSSGKHYGQFSCEGCKSFFKRSIRRSLSYSCRGTKDCPIDIHHRNQCQFCRLKKCIKMGMRKEAVQRGRVPSFAHPYPQPIIFPHSFLSHSLSPYLSPIISTLVRAEPLPKMLNTGTSNILGLDTIFEFGAQLLFSIVEWVRQLPFFVDLITSDQTTLLQSSWAQLFILYATQSGASRCNSTAFSAKSPLTTISDADGVTENCRLFQEQVGRIQSLHLDMAEMSCMKATLLFNPDTPSIQEQIKIETIQEKIQGALDDYCRTHKAHQPGRFGRILLRLPSLHTVTSRSIEQLFFSKLVGQKSVECILRDIFTQSSLVPKVWPHPIHPHQFF